MAQNLSLERRWLTGPNIYQEKTIWILSGILAAAPFIQDNKGAYYPNFESPTSIVQKFNSLEEALEYAEKKALGTTEQKGKP